MEVVHNVLYGFIMEWKTLHHVLYGFVVVYIQLTRPYVKGKFPVNFTRKFRVRTWPKRGIKAGACCLFDNPSQTLSCLESKLEGNGTKAVCIMDKL